MDFLHFSNGSAVDHFDGETFGEVGGNLDAHLGHQPFFSGLESDGSAFVEVLRQWLLSVNMKATIQRIDSD